MTDRIKQAISLLEQEAHFLISDTTRVTILKFSINLAKKILEDATQLFNKETNSDDLNKIYFTGTELVRAYAHGRRDFRGIILTESGFPTNSKIDFSFADFSGSDFSGHRLDVSLHKSKLTNCNFNKANLSGVYAGRADFTGSNFTDCDLSDSYLDETIFNHCNLTNANFYGAQWFRKASFKGAVFNNTLLPNKTRHTGKGE